VGASVPLGRRPFQGCRRRSDFELAVFRVPGEIRKIDLQRTEV
jgi:hypothetical protein